LRGMPVPMAVDDVDYGLSGYSKPWAFSPRIQPGARTRTLYLWVGKL
jgi:hypothetical protein